MTYCSLMAPFYCVCFANGNRLLNKPSKLVLSLTGRDSIHNPINMMKAGMKRLKNDISICSDPAGPGRLWGGCDVVPPHSPAPLSTAKQIQRPPSVASHPSRRTDVMLSMHIIEHHNMFVFISTGLNYTVNVN